MNDEMIKLGVQIADDSYNKSLKNGEKIVLRDIQNYIKEGDYLNPPAVLNAFIGQMKMYVEMKYICCYFEDGDVVYAHRQHKNTEKNCEKKFFGTR